LPPVGETYVNASKQLHRSIKEYELFNKKDKEGVNAILNFLKEVWANNDEIQYNYLLKWFATVAKGNKNFSALYVKSIEGVGKTTFIDFFVDYVITRDLYTKGDTDCLLTSNNMQLLGKPFVVFEELPVMNSSQWNLCDSKLKDAITGNEMMYCDKYEKKIKAENINNYVINTNHKALKRPDGRRYNMVDINTKYLNDFAYFKKLREVAFNDAVGYAFYCYLMKIDLSNYNSLDIPITSKKLDAIVELLPTLEKFLKFKYLLQNKNIKCKMTELYEEYENYCNSNKRHCEGLPEFKANMQNLGFIYKSKKFNDINGVKQFRISVDDLKALAEKKHWLHELDVDIMEHEGIEIPQNTELQKRCFEHGINKENQSILPDAYHALVEENKN